MRTKWRWIAALPLVVTFLLADESRYAWAQAREAAGATIVAITFTCDAPIDERALRELLPMRVGQSLREGDLQQARTLLEQTEIFSSVEIEPRTSAAGITLIIHVHRKSVVNRIAFDGNHALSDDKLYRAIRLREGMVLGPDALDQATERIRRRYADEGFASAQVTARAEPLQPGDVDVTFDIDEGFPLRVGTITIDGAGPVPVEEVRSALKLEPGDPYTRAAERAAEAAVVRLFRDKRFYQVTVIGTWEPDPLGRGDLHFTIDSGPPFALEFQGNEHLSEEKFLGLVDLSKRSIVTDGTWRELARRARYTYQERGYYFARVDVDIEQPTGNAPKLVRFTIKEGEPYHVRRVDFEGNRTLSADLLRAQMATQPPSWIPWTHGVLLDDVLEEDLRRLWYFYRRYGFEAAEIVDARTAFDAEDGTVTVTVFIEEGPQTLVRVVDPVGVEPIASKLPTLQTRVGQPLDPDAVAADREALLTAFHQQGYGAAEVVTETDSTHDEAGVGASVRFVAHPGGQQRIGRIIVQNNVDTRWKVLLRELPFHEGDPLDPDALLQGQQNLYRLGLFRSVTVRPLEEDSDAPVQDVVVRVAEHPAGHLQGGLGYNTRDGFTMFGEIGYNNLQGLARRVNLRGEFSLDPTTWTPNDYIGNLSFQSPRIFDSLFTFRNNLIAQRSTRSVDQFSIERFALIPAIERPLAPNLLGRIEVTGEQARVFNVAPDVLAFNPQDAGNLRTVSVSALGVYDRRDDPFIPQRGYFESLTMRVAPQQFGSSIPFVLVQAQHAQYVPLGDHLTFLYSLRGGWSHGLQAGEQVPIRYRFFVGGRTTVRGFAENSIGPTGKQGDPTGGNVLVDANSELRFPLIFGLLGAVFLDGGTVYLQNCPSDTVDGCGIDFFNFRRGAGPGLRYMTPVGPLSLDYGFKLDRRTGESVGEVHFSIGAMF
jgi:outer membrane protein insertion porin family